VAAISRPPAAAIAWTWKLRADEIVPNRQRSPSVTMK
jgi:hypothetical protein